VGELIGYARCSTVLQDLTAQREILASLGVAPDRIYLDKGLTGTARARPGLDQALAAVRAGDTLVVPKLDRLARSVPDACPQTPTPGKNRQVTMFGRLR
jgi:DNA invertase Pin-like site-specific DNA recombinase